eukprot:GFUD01096920.1.p1 GENE.GFUD01096920.1~~GFUD01096920.1.p1  ORF type:complete len:577 (+),score=127.54 GFUD01096920.1:215-1945(+)
MERRYNFDLLFLKRFLELHKILYLGKNYTNLIIFIVLLAIGGLETFVGYRVGLISGNFYKVLVDKDQDAFLSTCLESTALILGISVIKSIKKFTTRRLLVRWRRALCTHIQGIYLHGINFYKLSLFNEEIDNPDQRITADVNSLVTTYGGLVDDDLFLLPVATGYYAYKAYQGAGWIGPTGMFGLFLLSFINKIFMTPVANRTAQLERSEGDFRFKHMNIRDHSESLAFQGTIETELKKTNKSLDEVCTAQENLFNWTLPVDLSTNLFSYLGSIASYLVISIPVFSGHYDDLTNGDLAKMISNNGFVCIMLIFKFSQLVNMTSSVANMAGTTHRVAELIEKLTDYCDTPITIIEDNKDDDDSKHLLSMRGVDILTPKSDVPIIKGLNLSVEQGSNLLITGSSGAGKTSIFRVIRSLWPRISGTLDQIKQGNVFHFPQREYLSEGSLREQITEEAEPSGDPKQEDRISSVLETTQLMNLLNRCGGLDKDPGWNWSKILSPGEIQRLVWAKLLYQKPKLAFLDEATSAISESHQEALYNACIENDITVVSIGHRESLRHLHQKILVIDSVGGWTLTAA